MRSYSGKNRWIPGTVISKSGPLSYTISENGQKHKRHIDQLKKRARKDDSDDLCDDFMQISRKGATSDRAPEEPDNGTSELENADADLRDQAVETRRYQLRQNRHPPERFGH